MDGIIHAPDTSCEYDKKASFDAVAYGVGHRTEALCAECFSKEQLAAILGEAICRLYTDAPDV